MTTKIINCPKCGKQLEYWTISDFIECTGCKEQIQVEPCETKETEVIDETFTEVIEVEV
jgi:ssDNA-binding Zn-finger/Zn-ribbon topoisomerase 1